MPVPAIILAAGASRRLGQPKQLVLVAGETLLARTIRMALEAGAEPVLVVLGAHHETIAAQVDLSRVRPVINLNWESGIASSIHAGVRAIQVEHPDATAVMLLVCDQPRLTREHLRGLIEIHQEAAGPSIATSEYAGSLGIPAIFPASQFARLLALEGDTGAKALLRSPQCSVLAVRFAGGEIDVDAPRDLERIHDNSALKGRVQGVDFLRKSTL